MTSDLSSQGIDLRYILLSPHTKISLNLFEAELYEAAIVVQPLIGNLVYYSNRGRYEPRLAKSWRRISPTTWEFELHEDLVCENGEEITAASFKRSLERSIKIRAKDGGVPVFNKLKGFDSFIAGETELQGIQTQGAKLTLIFDAPIRSGVIQLLSFAPFGYICEENLNPDGSWRNNERFVSSGPYRIEKIEIGSRYVLTRRPEWKLPFAPGAPDRVEFSHTLPEEIDSSSAWIIDRVKEPEKLPSGLEMYPLVPEYLFAVFFGNLENGYFSKIENRRYFKKLVEKYRDKLLPETRRGWTRSRSMYPNLEPLQEPKHPSSGEQRPPDTADYSLTIEGREPTGGRAEFIWPALKAALEEANIKYHFAGNEDGVAPFNDRRYDLRMNSTSVGGGVDAWSISLKFCSKLGLMMPDPTGDICRLVDSYEQDELSIEELTQKFLHQINEDSAIVALGHLGGRLYLSPRIKKESISPALSIVRFDQLEIE